MDYPISHRYSELLEAGRCYQEQENRKAKRRFSDSVACTSRGSRYFRKAASIVAKIGASAKIFNTQAKKDVSDATLAKFVTEDPELWTEFQIVLLRSEMRTNFGVPEVWVKYLRQRKPFLEEKYKMKLKKHAINAGLEETGFRRVASSINTLRQRPSLSNAIKSVQDKVRKCGSFSFSAPDKSQDEVMGHGTKFSGNQVWDIPSSETNYRKPSFSNKSEVQKQLSGWDDKDRSFFFAGNSKSEAQKLRSLHNYHQAISPQDYLKERRSHTSQEIKELKSIDKNQAFSQQRNYQKERISRIRSSSCSTDPFGPSNRNKEIEKGGSFNNYYQAALQRRHNQKEGSSRTTPSSRNTNLLRPFNRNTEIKKQGGFNDIQAASQQSNYEKESRSYARPSSISTDLCMPAKHNRRIAPNHSFRRNYELKRKASM